MTTIRDLRSLCHKVARKNPEWVQGPGGNLSLKKNKDLFIKASGIRLEKVNAQKGIVTVNGKKLHRDLKLIPDSVRQRETLYAHALKENTKTDLHQQRPSMEAGFHIFLPKPIVAHFHALSALLMAHEHKKNPSKMKAWLKKHWKGGVHFVKPFSPGLILAKYLGRNRQHSLYILENHGIVVQSNKTDFLKKWSALERIFYSHFNYKTLMNASWKKSTKLKPTPLRLFFPDSAVFLDRLKKVLLKKGSKNGEPLYILKRPLGRIDQGVREIWEATALLYHACPGLKSIPNYISRTVANIPVEKYRRLMHHKGKRT